MMIAIGRQPNVESLSLEVAGIEFSLTDGIYADKFLATSNQSVYSVGDCLARATSKS